MIFGAAWKYCFPELRTDAKEKLKSRGGKSPRDLSIPDKFYSLRK
jgi:hypothetical protein